MKKFDVELRVQHPNGRIGIDCTIQRVFVNATSHRDAKKLAEARHNALVLSTEEVKDGA